VSFVLLVGSSLFVTTVIFYYGFQAIRTRPSPSTQVPAGGED